jgi:hypothetical protein
MLFLPIAVIIIPLVNTLPSPHGFYGGFGGWGSGKGGWGSPKSFYRYGAFYGGFGYGGFGFGGVGFQANNGRSNAQANNGRSNAQANIGRSNAQANGNGQYGNQAKPGIANYNNREKSGIVTSNSIQGGTPNQGSNIGQGYVQTQIGNSQGYQNQGRQGININEGNIPAARPMMGSQNMGGNPPQSMGGNQMGKKAKR